MSQVAVEASIKTESSRNAKLTTDIDNFRSRYIDKDPNSNVEVIYPSFEISTFERNFFKLLQASELVDFQSRWIMRPDYVSYDKYGTVIYWPLIMYLNRIPVIEEFTDLEQILIPPFASIFELYNDRDLEKEKIVLREEPRDNIFVNQFYKDYPLDKNELERLKAKEELLGSSNENLFDIATVEKTDTIVLTSTDITNKYVDLSYVPINPTGVTVKLNNLPLLQRYNYDYTLIFGNKYQNRVTWKPANIIANSEVTTLVSSMNNYIKAGDTLTIKYQASVTYRIADGPPSI